MTDRHGQDYWDARYGSNERVWSGNPNHQLVEQVAALAPGRALEVGSGEGADAIWLAERGWRVTAVDVSPVALARAAEHAAEHGAEVADRIAWRPADFRTWTPEPAAYDLVTAHFVHPPADARPRVVKGLAAAVAPGGTLLYVGHDRSDRGVVPRPDELALLPLATEVAELLEPGDWEIEVAEALPRAATHPRHDGPVTLHDAVLRARRRG